MAATIASESGQIGRGFTPLTERILPSAGGGRWLAIMAWTAMPFLRLVALMALAAGAGLAETPADVARIHLSGSAFNAYTLLIVLLGIRPVTNQLARVAGLGDEQTARMARLTGSTVWPLLLALAFTVLSESSDVVEFGAPSLASAPFQYVVTFLLAYLVRLPQAVGLWAAVIALLSVAELGRHPVPGTFPEDRSLGLRQVGSLLTTILLFYVAIVVPAFIFGAERLIDLLFVIGITAIGLAAMLVAVWQIHRRMTAQRLQEIEGATTRYAAAYRRAASDPTPDNGSQLQIAQSLLDGAKSIHEWPFDDRTERVAGLLLTSVAAGVIGRLVLIGLGF